MSFSYPICRNNNLFQELQKRSLTDKEQEIVAARTSHMQKMFEEYEKREKKRKVQELMVVCPDMTEKELECALTMYDGNEDEAAGALTSDPALKRRVQNIANGSLMGENHNNNTKRRTQSNTREKYIAPKATAKGGVFIGSFRGKMMPKGKPAEKQEQVEVPKWPTGSAGKREKRKRSATAGSSFTSSMMSDGEAAEDTAAVNQVKSESTGKQSVKKEQGQKVLSIGKGGATTTTNTTAAKKKQSTRAKPISLTSSPCENAKIDDIIVKAKGQKDENTNGNPEANNRIEKDKVATTKRQAAPKSSPKKKSPRKEPGTPKQTPRKSPRKAPATPGSVTKTAETVDLAQDKETGEVESSKRGGKKLNFKSSATPTTGNSTPKANSKKEKDKVATTKKQAAPTSSPKEKSPRKAKAEESEAAAEPSKSSKAATAPAAAPAPEPQPAAKRPARAKAKGAGPRKKPSLGRVRQKSTKRGEVVEIGTVRFEKGWHNRGYIFPDGFFAKTPFRSSVEIDQLVIHECRILGKGGQYWPAPTFQIVTADRPDEEFNFKSATGCWSAVLKRINSEISRRRDEGEDLPPPPRTAIAGPEYFGLNQPDVIEQIEAQDPEHKCYDYWDGKMDREEYIATGAVLEPRVRKVSSSKPRSSKKRGSKRRKRNQWSDSEETFSEEEADLSTKWNSVNRSERYKARCKDRGMEADVDDENPIPEFIDPITLESVINPGISPYGHVMGMATWRAVLSEQGSQCPFTKQELSFIHIKKLTKTNIESFRDKIVNFS